jgi:hypothetical protein
VAFTKHGDIRVKVEREDVTYTSDDQTSPPDEVALEFVVSDTGEGMSPEKRHSICNLLFSPPTAMPLDYKDLPYVCQRHATAFHDHSCVREGVSA